MNHDLLGASTAWMDQFWDDDAGLLWNVRREQHLVRETVLYALGLLLRAGAGDEARAHQAIATALTFQFDERDAPFHGTFRRAPEEPEPPPEAVMWIHYDPNWRQFIGTNLAVIVDNFELPQPLGERVLGAIALAAASEDPHRVVPTYANIALMKAWLDRWDGERTGDKERIATSDEMARNVAKHFDEHQAFLEYNSPTYYGIDLWALALWRDADGPMGELGPRLEAALWDDIARFYHADLRNMCGPFDRCYGMDMTRYATPLGLFIWAALDREHAPFPDTSGKFFHPHDFAFGPVIAMVEPRLEGNVLDALRAFGGERTLDRTISDSPHRRATAWLGTDTMLGGQVGPTSGIGFFQHAHATMHWRASDGRVGWARLGPEVGADAVASSKQLEVEANTTTSLTFEIRSADASITPGAWHVDGRTIVVTTNAPSMTPAAEGDRILATYEPAPSGATTFTFSL